MASNTFGKILRMTTWGESHGQAIGVIIDGCPAGLPLNDRDINMELAKRAPGRTPYTTPRREPDEGKILSGVFENQTTGTPIAIIIDNHNADSGKYEPIKDLLRPGHANYAYLKKYGLFDYRGGGRASARETACRVAAGVIAKKILEKESGQVIAFLEQIGDIQCEWSIEGLKRENITSSSLFCPDPEVEKKMITAIQRIKEEGDSLGGTVCFVVTGIPSGLGDPLYEKLEANLAKAMMTIPASKGFEIGSGFESVTMRGSEHNDPFTSEKGRIVTTTNHAGGILGGISNGMPIFGRVAFKPTSSIMKPQETVDREGRPSRFELPKGSRHDPCVAIRAVPVVEAMVAWVLADALLINRSSKCTRSP